MAADPTGGYWTVTAGRCGDAPRLRPGPRLPGAVRAAAGPAHRRHGVHARRRRATGSSPPTAASSTTATPCSTALPGPSTSTGPSSAWPPRPTAAGYWLVASDGGIFSYGDATFYGSTGSIHLNRPIVGMAPTVDGAGYWLVASDGGIFNYGDAALPRLHGGHPPQPADRRHGAHARRCRLLARRLRRRRLHLRRRRVLRLDGGRRRRSPSGIIVDPAASATASITDRRFGGLLRARQRRSRASARAAADHHHPRPTAPRTTTPHHEAAIDDHHDQAATRRPRSPDAGHASGRQRSGRASLSHPANPSGWRSFAAETGTSPTVATDYLPGNSRLGRHGRLRREPQLAARSLAGERLHALAGRADHPDQLERDGRRHPGPGCERRLQPVLHDPGADAGQRRSVRMPTCASGWEFDGSWMPWDATTPSSRGQLRLVLPADRDGHAAVPGENFRFVWNPDAGAFTQSGLLGRRRLPRQRLRRRDRPRRLRPVLGDAADTGQRAGPRPRCRRSRRPSSSPRRTASRSPSPSGAWPSGATATGSATTRTSSTRWCRGWRTPPTT